VGVRMAGLSNIILSFAKNPSGLEVKKEAIIHKKVFDIKIIINVLLMMMIRAVFIRFKLIKI
jgi:hypothetical protein